MRTQMRLAVRRAVQKIWATERSKTSRATVEGLESRTLLTGTYYVPPTIAHDYSADVTEDLEAFFATVDAGSTIVFPDLDYNADTVGYNIEGTLSILNMNDVVIEGNGAFLRAFDYDPPDARNRRHVSIGDTNDGVTMQNFTIIGADPTPGTFSAPREAQHGLSLGGSNILIDNVDIFSVAGDFVYFGAGANNVTVQNSYFDGAGRQGIAPCNGHDILIQNNYINNVGRHLLDFEPDGLWYAKNVRIIGNTLGKSGMSVLVASGGPFVNNILLANNTVLGPNGFQYTLNESGGSVNRRQNWALINNSTFHFRNEDYDIGMRYSNTNGVIVAGNSEIFGDYPNPTQHYAVSLNNVVGAIVADNKWVDATYSVKNMNSSSIWNANDVIVSTPNDPGIWQSSTTMTELSIPATYGFVIPYSGTYNGQSITSGHMYVISRYTDNMGSLTFNGLTSTDRTAAVIVDANGNFVTGWTLGEAGGASYNGTPLEQLHEVPIVSQQPIDQYGAVGQTVQFTVVPDGDGPLSFQWQRNGVDIPGATRSEYLHTIQSVDNLAQITCIVSSPWGAPKTTTVALVRVVAAAAPTIVTQPINSSVAAGLTATFSVSGAGSQGPLSYQWKRNGTNIAGATTSSYTIATVLADNGAQFSCVVTNPTGSVTSNAATLGVASPTQTDTFTGTSGAWPSTWSFTGTGNLIFDINNNMGRVQHLVTGASDGIAVQNSFNTINSDQTVTFSFDHNSNGISLVARAADNDSDSFYYAYQSFSNPDRLYIYRMINGTSLALGYTTIPAITTGVQYKMRFLCQQNGDATDLMAKAWLATDPEPDGWTCEVSNTTAALQNLSGRIGIRFATPKDKIARVDNYSGTALPSGVAPDVPGAFDATAISSRHVSLQWSDVAGELGYKVERSADGTTWTEVATVAADKFNATDPTVSPNTLYYYRLWAYNLTGVTAYVGAAATVTTPAEPATPAAPGGPQVSAISGSESIVTWTDNSSTEYGFRIERSLNGTTGWQQASLAAPGTTVFYDRGLTLGTTYYYRVVAYNNTGSSSPTSVVNATTQSDTFGETFTDYTGAGWPSQWTREGGAGNLTITGNRGQHSYLSTGGRVINYINNANAENINQIASFTISPNNANAGLIARRTDADSDTYYFAKLVNDNATSRLYLYKMVDGVETSLAQSNSFTWSNPSTYQLRFNCQTNGGVTTLQAKVWLATEPEPTNWSVAFHDSTAVLQGRSGRFGIFSAVSDGRTITVDNWWAGPATLAAPSGLQVTATAPTQIDLSWTDNSPNEAGFVIERSLDGASSWQQVGTALANLPTFRDTGLTTGTVYYYRVRAYNTGVNSAYSNLVIATAQAQLAENWTGANAAAWPSTWSFIGSGNLTYDINGNMGRVRHLTGGASDGVTLQNSLNTINSDQTLTFRYDSANGGVGLVSRAADSNNDTFYYTYQSLATYPDRLYIYKMVNNAETALGYVTITAVTQGQLYKVRFLTEQNGSSTALKAKTWLASAAEPTAWMVSLSDSTAVLQNISSRVGIRFAVPQNRIISVDDYSVVPNGSPTVMLAATDASAVEAGADKGTFTITRSNTLGGALAVTYTIGGTAASGDYSEMLTGTVTIPAGQFSTTIDITPVNDSSQEADETLILTLTSASGYVLGLQAADTVTIRNTPPATDDFESGNGTGGSGWSGNWTLTGSASFNASNAYSGGYSLRFLSGNGVATRTADLSETSGAHLTFQWKANSFEVNDYGRVEIYNGTTWIEVIRFVDGQDDNAYHFADIDLSLYTLTSNFQVRFSSNMANDDYFYVDDVVIR